MLHAQDVQSLQTEYIATVLWSIGRLIGGEDYPLPTYDDTMHPKPQDKRTTEAIVGGLVQKLQKGVVKDVGTV